MGRQGVAVLGGGPWGLALASAAARSGRPVWLMTRRAVEVAPRGVTVVRSGEQAVPAAALVMLAVPSSSARDSLASIAPWVDEAHVVVHGIRGLVGIGLDTISSIVKEVTPSRCVGAVGGPILAADLLAEQPVVVVLGVNDPRVELAMRDAFPPPYVRTYVSDDLRGVEWASALIGCLGVVVGYAQQAGLAPGLIAAALTRGVQEAARLAAAAGAEPATLLGLAGYGDLLASMTQRDRPEVRLGAVLARGATVAEAAREVRARVEAVDLIPRLAAWAVMRGVRAPVFTAMATRVFAGRPVPEVVDELMALPVEDSG